MECLNNLVGVGAACETAKPYQLKSIDITESFLNKIVVDEYDTGVELGQAKISFAANSMAAEASQFFISDAYTQSVIDEQTIGLQRPTTSTSTGWAGIRFKIPNDTVHIRLDVVEIQLQLEYTGTVTVKGYNLKDGSEILSQDIDVVSGVITSTPIMLSEVSAKRLTDIALVYDTTGITARKYTVSASCGSCNKWSTVGKYVSATGVQFSGGFQSANATTIAHTSGMSLRYSLNCDYSSFLCSIKSQLGLPLLHKAAADIYVYQLTNNRFNDRSDDEFDAISKKIRHHESEYGRLMNIALNNLRLPSNECFGCKQSFGFNTILPG